MRGCLAEACYGEDRDGPMLMRRSAMGCLRQAGLVILLFMELAGARNLIRLPAMSPFGRARSR
jgi:hypothetical protein